MKEKAPKIIHLEVCQSTNDEARKYCGNTIIISLRQTNGRGTHDRSFSSEQGNGLYASFVFDCENIPVEFSGHITLGAANCVHDAILETYNIGTDIKWINDLILDNKKVCGILCEAIGFETRDSKSEGPFFVPNMESKEKYFESIKNRKEPLSGTKYKRFVIGVGLNLGRKEFPDDIKSIATSLSVCNETSFDILDKIALSIYKKLSTMVNNLDAQVDNFFL